MLLDSFLLPLSIIIGAIATISAIMGVMRIIKAKPMLSTTLVKGEMVDARLSKTNIYGKDFGIPRYYIYYHYKVDNVTFGSSSISQINDSYSRSKQLLLIDDFNKGKRFVDVFVNKSDYRKSFLVSSDEFSNPYIFLSLFLSVVSLLLYIFSR